ncbi:hypothetical protein DNU06_11600 [Putridiphycobacter roseus]|uniref:Uncharacterized protein n=1 Tax=Putridiphycobacter roseus TaxID=2219161 RepID=A0A2W1NMK7_9FLAO|nr:hypothetical protein [Putridiphycobacter roseus]PZE16892.1 hypothetical protein DNU06_11600 [Putridiphycobacter roseus]
MKNLLFLISFVLLFAACKKIEPNYIAEGSIDPIYKMSGKIDNKLVSFEVDDTITFLTEGLEKFYAIQSMYTKIEHKKSKQSLKISVIQPEKMYQLINDYNAEAHALSFFYNQEQCFRFIFSTAIDLPQYFNYQEENAFVNSDEITLKEKGIHYIPVRFKGVSNATFDYMINYGFESTQFNAKFKVTKGVNSILFDANMNGNHQWFVDGALISEDKNGEIELNDGLYQLTHILTDERNNTTSYATIINVHMQNLAWELITEKCEPVATVNNFQTVYLEYTLDGVKYSSKNTLANNNQLFNLSDIEYFKASATSPISVKFTAKFNATLYDKTMTNKIELTDFEGTFKYEIL